MSCASEPLVIFPPEPEPLRVTFSRDVLGMLVGVSTTVAVEVVGGPAGIDRRVAFTSSDSSIVALSPAVGNETVLRAIRVGTARVTAASIVDQFVRDTLDVVVVSVTSPTRTVLVTAIRSAGSSLPVDTANVAGMIDVHYAVAEARIDWRVELALAAGPLVPCTVLVQSEFVGACSMACLPRRTIERLCSTIPPSDCRMLVASAGGVAVSDAVRQAAGARTELLEAPGLV